MDTGNSWSTLKVDSFLKFHDSSGKKNVSSLKNLLRVILRHHRRIAILHTRICVLHKRILSLLRRMLYLFTSTLFFLFKNVLSLGENTISLTKEFVFSQVLLFFFQGIIILTLRMKNLQWRIFRLFVQIIMILDVRISSYDLFMLFAYKSIKLETVINTHNYTSWPLF